MVRWLVIPFVLLASGCLFPRSYQADENFTDPAVIEIARAIEAGETGRVEQLLADGADADAGEGRMTMAKWAVAMGRLDSLTLLLAAGADPDGTGDGGRPLLFEAVRTRDPDYVTTVLGAGADPGIRHPVAKTYVLHEACSFPERSVLESLIPRVPDLNATDAEGGTALHVCGVTNQGALVLLLLDAGADPLATDNSGRTFQDGYFTWEKRLLNERAAAERASVVAWLEARGIPVDPRA